MMMSSRTLESSSDGEARASISGVLFNIGEASKETIVSTAKNGFEERVIEIVDWQGCMERSECDGRQLFKCKRCSFASEWLNVVRHVQRVHKLLISFGSTADGSHGNKGEFKLWPCDKCKYKTPRLNLMFRHLLRHGAACKLCCKSCNYSTNRQVDLEQHDVLCHGGISESNPIVEDSRSSSVERNMECIFCDAKFCTGDELDGHVQRKHHTDVKSYTCSKCSKSYCSQMKLTKHMWIAHNESNVSQKMDQQSVFSCPHCRYYSNRRDLVKSHIRCRHPEESKNHMTKSHTSAKSHTSVSHRKITSAKSLSNVKARLKERSGKWFHCSHCSFQSKWKCALSRHKLKKHQVIEPNRNRHEQMNSRLNSSPDELAFEKLKSSSLERSKISSVDELKYDEDKGDAGDTLLNEALHNTGSAKQLSSHEPLALNGGGASFYNTGLTTSNKATHFKSGQAIPSCKYCSKTFKNAHRLARHVSSHLNLRQFQCKKCDYRCNAREYLITHARNKHNLTEASKFLIELTPSKALATISECKFRFPKSSRALDSVPVSECDLGLDVTVECDPSRNDSNPDSSVNDMSSDSHGKNGNSPVVSLESKICCKVFGTIGKLAAHSGIHSEFKKFECKECNFRSCYKAIVEKHAYKTHKSVNTEPLLVDLQPEQFQQTIDVQVSIGNEVSEQSQGNSNSCSNSAESFACSKCSLNFPSLLRLSRHLVVHDNLRQFMCSECGHRCNFRHNLVKHLKLRHKISSPESFIVELSPTKARETIDVLRSQDQPGVNRVCSSKNQVTARKTRPIERCSDREPVEVRENKPVTEQQLMSECVVDVMRVNSPDKNASLLDSLEVKSGNKKNGALNYYRRKKVDKNINVKRFMCTECDYRSRWPSNVYSHKRCKHPKASVVDVERSLTVACSAAAISENQIKIYAKSKGLRRYKCDYCGHRSDWSQNIRKHINSQHASANCMVLSVEEAQETLADYKARIALLSDANSNNVSAAKPRSPLKKGNLKHSPAKPHSPLKKGNLKHSPAKPQSPLKKGNLKHSSGTIDALRLRRFSCSLCHFRSNYFHEVSKHSRIKHEGLESSVQFLPEHVARATLTEYNTLYFGNKRMQLGETSIVGSSDVIEDDDEKLPSTPGKQSDKDGELLCNLCPYKAPRSHHLESHLRMHTARPGCNLKCSYCSYYTSNEHFLKKHLGLHEDKSLSAVSVRKRLSQDQTDDATVLEKHPTRAEKKQPLFSCDHCPFISKYSDCLLSHKQLHRPRVSASFKCTHCAFWTKNQHIINQHLEVHEPDYVEKRTNKLMGTSQRPNKLPSVDVVVEQEIIETATIKQKLIANRFSSRAPSKGPRHTSFSPAKLQKNVDLTMDSIAIETTPSAPVFDVILASEERRTSRSQQLWRCDKCPYSVDSVLLFKRHVYLHGRKLTYECLHCDYSVPSCWRMQEHRRLHLVENQNLLHSQSVSNLLFLPSRLQTPGPTWGERLDLFEDSSEFNVSGFQSFRCSHCPFVSSRKTDFHAHLRCHFSRSEHSCPFCDFSTCVLSTLSAHVSLHFSLPGADTSSLPPSSGEMQPWKSIGMEIESISLNCSDYVATFKIDESSSCSELAVNEIRGISRTSSYVKTQLFVDNLESPLEKNSTSSDCRPAHVEMSGDGKSSAVLGTRQQRQLRHEKSVSSSSVFYVCQYCDRPFDSSDLLAKHEDVHLHHSSSL